MTFKEWWMKNRERVGRDFILLGPHGVMSIARDAWDQSALEVIQIDYPQIFFTVQWMCKINTESFAPASLKEMKELADECHVAYLKET